MAYFDFSKAEFFKKGTIIPQRILKGPRKLKHHIIFGSNVWCIPTPKGYLIAVDISNGDCVVRLKYSHKHKDINLFSSPYTKKGVTRWIGNHESNPEDWQKLLDKQLERMQ